MAQVPFALVTAVGGMVLVAMAGFLAWRHVLILRRRALASAFVGELAGVLRIIETGKLEERLHQSGGKRRPGRSMSKYPALSFPVPAIYEANAIRLGLFEPSLARKIANVYTLLKGVTGNLPMVVGDAEQSKATLVQLQEGLSLADEVLHGLRPWL